VTSLALRAPRPTLQGCTAVWLMELRDGGGSAPDRWLAPDELRRARAFRRDEDRRRFTAGRALVRLVVGQELDVPPGNVVLEAGPNGKPMTASAGEALPHFNLSHAGAIVVVAVDRFAPVGVDVETVRRRPTAAAIAERVCDATELDELRRLGPTEADALFARCWTRKEAVAKGGGEGVSAPFTRISVPLGEGAADEPAFLGTVALPDMWSLWDLPVPVGYVAALAVAGLRRSVKVHVRDEAWLWGELRAARAA
jgi:4'-phosphopantetheinyl transferase